MAIDLVDDLSRRDILCLAGAAAALIALGASPLAALAQTGPGGGPVKIATIGSGREGGALGTLFAKAGHPVMFSSRHPDQLGELVASAGPNAKAGTVQQAVDFADVVLLVVPYSAIEQIGREHAKALATKQLVMDVSNPIARRDGEELVKSVEQQGGPGLATAKMLPGSRIVRAFNAIGSAQLAQLAGRPGDPVGVPIAGEDQKAVQLASQLIKKIGFEPVVVGGLAMGKYLVPGTPLALVHTPDEIREIAATLK
jgi:hypothetical protein